MDLVSRLSCVLGVAIAVGCHQVDYSAGGLAKACTAGSDVCPSGTICERGVCLATGLPIDAGPAQDASASSPDSGVVRDAASGAVDAGASCGNGSVEDFEQCDDGNGLDDDDCSNDCVFNCYFKNNFETNQSEWVAGNELITREGLVSVLDGSLLVERSRGYWGKAEAVFRRTPPNENELTIQEAFEFELDVALRTSSSTSSATLRSDEPHQGDHGVSHNGYHIVLNRNNENGSPSGLYLYYNSDHGNEPISSDRVLIARQFEPQVNVFYRVRLEWQPQRAMRLYLDGDLVGEKVDSRVTSFSTMYLHAGHDSADNHGAKFDNVRLCRAPIAQTPGPDTPSRSCLALHESDPNSSSGTYWIDPNGGDSADAFEAYCDMETDGGGWTIVFPRLVDSSQRVEGQRFEWEADAYGLPADGMMLMESVNEALLAYRGQGAGQRQDGVVVDTRYARLPIPEDWRARPPTQIERGDLETEVSVGGESSVTAWLRYGSRSWLSDASPCSADWKDEITTYGRVCIQNTNAPYFARFAIEASNWCSVSDAPSTTDLCTAQRFFSIAVR